MEIIGIIGNHCNFTTKIKIKSDCIISQKQIYCPIWFEKNNRNLKLKLHLNDMLLAVTHNAMMAIFSSNPVLQEKISTHKFSTKAVFATKLK